MVCVCVRICAPLSQEAKAHTHLCGDMRYGSGEIWCVSLSDFCLQANRHPLRFRADSEPMLRPTNEILREGEKPNALLRTQQKGTENPSCMMRHGTRRMETGPPFGVIRFLREGGREGSKRLSKSTQGRLNGDERRRYLVFLPGRECAVQAVRAGWAGVRAVTKLLSSLSSSIARFKHPRERCSRGRHSRGRRNRKDRGR
jgi:hypothetical protein